MHGKQKNYFILRLLKVFAVAYRLQPVCRGEMVYPHMLSISAASIAQLHKPEYPDVAWFQTEGLLRESKCDAGEEGQGAKRQFFSVMSIWQGSLELKL